MSFTHHAAGRLQLSVRNTLEVLLAAAVVFGAVAHGPEGRQQVLHRLKVSGHHGFFSGGDKEDHTLNRSGHVVIFALSCAGKAVLAPPAGRQLEVSLFEHA